MSRRLTLAFPGRLETLTGGYVYDRRLALALEARGWRVERLSLPEGFPFPNQEQKTVAAELLRAANPAGALLSDGLALGALPEVAASLSTSHDLVALVHHPLCLETGLSPTDAQRLEVSERAALAAARAVVVTSSATAATLTERFAVPPSRLVAAPPGVDPAPAARGSGGPGCRLVCVGTVTARKGHRLLVEALSKLRELPWELACAGSLDRDPPTAAELRSAIERHRLSRRVHLLGELDPAAMAALYDGADLCVSASLYEGYGMALSEALARGLPVIAAAGGAVADTVPAAAGLLVPPGDVPALRAALRHFLTRPELRARLREGALAARSWLPSWDETAGLVETALERR